MSFHRTALVSFIVVLTTAIFAEEISEDLLSQQERAAIHSPEQLDLIMTILEPDGGFRKRDLTIMQKRSPAEEKTLIQVSSPNDLKGTRLLTHVKNDTEIIQWHYVHGETKPRLIKGSLRKNAFLESELSFEDLSLALYRNCKNKNMTATPTDASLLFESRPLKKQDSAYMKIKTWIDKKNHYPLKAEFYESEDTPSKLITYHNHKRYNGVWRAQKVEVKNLKNNRSTVLEIQKVIPKNFSDDEFTQKNLEN